MALCLPFPGKVNCHNSYAWFYVVENGKVFPVVMIHMRASTTNTEIEVDHGLYYHNVLYIFKLITHIAILTSILANTIQ